MFRVALSGINLSCCNVDFNLLPDCSDCVGASPFKRTGCIAFFNCNMLDVYPESNIPKLTCC